MIVRRKEDKHSYYWMQHQPCKGVNGQRCLLDKTTGGLKSIEEILRPIKGNASAIYYDENLRSGHLFESHCRIYVSMKSRAGQI